MGTHTRGRRAVVCRAAVLACAAAGPLLAGTVLLLTDALGGVVGMPGDAVSYTAFTGLLLACLGVPLVLRLARRVPAPRMTAVAGGLAALLVAAAGLVPGVPVFASAMVLAGALGGPLLVLPRSAAGPRAYVWPHVAALAGLAAAAQVAAAFTDTPDSALIVAGVAAAVLAVVAIGVPRTTPSPEESDPAHPTPARSDRGRADLNGRVRVGGSSSRFGSRDAFAVARPALPAYAASGAAVAVTVQGGLHLLLFRWNMVGSDPIALLAWTAVPAVAIAAVAGPLARSARTVPWLLLAAATAPALAATAPVSWALPAAFTIALAAATVTAAGLDTAILGPAPAGPRPALAGLTAGAAVLAGLAATGVLALLGRVVDDASALTLTAVPIAAAALTALRLPEPGPPADPAPAPPPLLEVRGLSAGSGPAAVRDVSLQVRAGEAVAVFGPGARTLLSAVAGHLPPDRGTVVMGGADVTAVPPGRRAGLGLSHLVRAGTRDGRSVTELLRARAAALGRADPGTAAAAVLEVFPSLRDRAHEPAADLDEPRARLLGLAEALVTRPRLLLVDGLSPGLDRVSADVLAATVRRLLAEGTALLLAEPVIPVVLSVCGRVHVLRRGRTAAELTAPTPEQVHHLLHRGGRPT